MFAPRVVVLLFAGALLASCGSDVNVPENPAGAGAANIDCPTGTLNAAGSSAQKPAMVAWIDEFQRMCGDAAINYDAQGSNNGRTQFVQRQVPMAGSDAVLTGEQKAQADQRCAPGTAIDLPMVVTPIAIAYNLKGIDALTLTPALLGRIFDGRITVWNDPAIVAVNPGVALPDRTITPVHRSADSGTSENLTRFLVAQAPEAWPHKPSQAWPNSVGVGASISTTMVLAVKQTDGAIGYVDNPDATNNRLATAAIDVGHGPVRIGPEAATKAVEATVVKQTGLDIALELPYGLRQPGAYPALLATYEITCSAGLPAEEARFVKSFLGYTASDAGQRTLVKAGYVPLPASLRSRVQAAVAQIDV